MSIKILDYVYPNTCGFCNKIISKDYTCKSCKEKLKYMYESTRMSISVRNNFDVLVCAYKYSGIIRNKILAYKFRNKKYLYRTLSERLAELLNDYILDIDFIIPVPIHFFRYFKRGYNQSTLIANFISEKLSKKVYNNILKKKRNTKPQSTLTSKRRHENAKNAYVVYNSDVLKNKTILLIDDIYTTGATVDECSRILKMAGAKRVIVGTIAKATLKSHIAKEERKWMN